MNPEFSPEIDKNHEEEDHEIVEGTFEREKDPLDNRQFLTFDGKEVRTVFGPNGQEMEWGEVESRIAKARLVPAGVAELHYAYITEFTDEENREAA